MQVYDTVNKLAEEIKTSKEYLDLKKAKEQISSNIEYQTKISNFNKLRYEQQLNTIQTGKTDESKMQEIQKLYAELIEVEPIKNYFDAEIRFNVILADVNKAISEAVKDVIS